VHISLITVCCTGHITKSELHFYAKYGNPPSTAKAAAWLTGKNTSLIFPTVPCGHLTELCHGHHVHALGAGVFHGPLVFGSENVGDKLFAGELLDYPSDVVVG